MNEESKPKHPFKVWFNKHERKINIALIVAILLILVIAAIPTIHGGRPKKKCSEVQKAWTILAGESERGFGIQQTVGVENLSTQDILALAIGNYYSGQPYYWDDDQRRGRVVLPSLDSPYNNELPLVIVGIKKIEPESGQVAIQIDPSDPHAINVYRDLTFDPICGEPEPVKATIRASD